MSSGVSGESLRAERSSSLAVAGSVVWSMRARARKARAFRSGLSVVRVVAWRSSAWARESLAVAGEEEAEGEVGVEVGRGRRRWRGDRWSRRRRPGPGFGEGVLREGEVVEEVGVVGRLFGEGGEEFEGGGVVLFFEGFVCLGEERVLLLGLGLGRVGGSRGELGLCWYRQERVWKRPRAEPPEDGDGVWGDGSLSCVFSSVLS